MEEIVILIGNCLVIPVIFAVYLYLTMSVYPMFTLRLEWRAPTKEKVLGPSSFLKRHTTRPPGDRGVRRLVFPGGRAIVYEPAPKYRRYLRQYALVKKDGYTYIRCRVHEKIAHIRYDVVTFDAKGRFLDVLHVSERITETGSTAAVRLPRKTAYACVTLRQADKMYEENDVTTGYSVKWIMIYTVLSVVTALLAASALYQSAEEILHGIFYLEGNRAMTLVTAGILGAVTAEWVVFRYHRMNSKGMRK